jgi:hypothetical protein
MAGRPKTSRKERKVSQTVPSHHPRTAPKAAEDPPADARAAKVQELRRAWLEGRLDLSVSEESPGWERLLDDLLER